MTARNGNSGKVAMFAGVDGVAVLLYAALTLVGFAAILSASWDEASENIFAMSHNYMKQAMWIGVAWFVGLVVLLLDSSIWHKFAYYAYALGIVALLATLALGREVNGAKAWFEFGGVRVQPMEFAKIAIALATARMMSDYSFSLNKAGDVFRVALLLLVPLGITVLQNDTGSGIVLGSFLFVLYREGLNKWICIPILFIAALFIISFLISPTVLLIALITIFVLSEAMTNGRWKVCVRYVAGLFLASIVIKCALDAVLEEGFDYYKSLLIATLLSLVVVVRYAYRNNLRNIYVATAIFFMSMMFLPTSNFIFESVLRPHQKDRIMSFLGIVNDFNNDYNVNQSKIAIGSGGLFGKGYLQGSQIRYNFVPEKHTDFIFCTIGEEKGFVGAVAVLLLIGALIMRLMRMGDRQQESFGRVYCYCVAAILLFHTLVNVGMTIGIVPVMGIPLPFISYGGSSLVAFTILVFIAFSLDAATRKALPTYGAR